MTRHTLQSLHTFSFRHISLTLYSLLHTCYSLHTLLSTLITHFTHATLVTYLVLIRCMSVLDTVKVDSSDEQTGVDIIKRALPTPCSTIASNAGVDASRVVEKILQSSNPNEGYDALHNEYVDMIQAG